MADSEPVILKSFGKDTLTYVPYRIFPVLFGFLGLWVYTRVFTPSDYGIYSIVNITIGLLGIFAYSWINESHLRFFVPYKNGNRLEIYFSTSFLLLALTLAALSGVLLFLGYISFLPEGVIDYLLLIIGVIVVLSFFETCLTLLRSDRKANQASFYRSISAVFYLVISLALIFLFKMGIESILISYIITNAGLTATIVLRNNYLGYIRLDSFSFDSLREFVAYGLPLTAALVFSWVLLVSDRYFIEFFKGSYEVGIYSAAYQLADYPISMFTSMMLIAAFPIIIDTWEKKGEQATKSLITGLMRYYFIFVIPAFAGVVILSMNLMCILTDEYFSGYMIVPFVCLSKALFGVCWYLDKGMELKKKTVIVAVLIAISAILDIGLNLVLVPAYGFVGAGIAQGIAYSFYCVISLVVSRRYLNWAMPVKSIKNITMAALVMAVVLVGVKQYLDLSVVSLFLLVGLGALTFFVCIILTGEIKTETGFATKVAGDLIKSRLPGVVTIASNVLPDIKNARLHHK